MVPYRIFLILLDTVMGPPTLFKLTKPTTLPHFEEFPY